MNTHGTSGLALVTIFTALALAGCHGQPAATNNNAKPLMPKLSPANQQALTSAGVMPAWLDRSAAPCQDFFAYACGGFVRTAVIPPDRSSWSAIAIVSQRAEEFLRDYLTNAAVVKAGRDANTQKLGDYFAACMDEAEIEQQGLAPLAPYRALIASVRDPASAAAAVIALHRDGFTPFFDIAAGQDNADATRVIANLDQAGIGLPDRDYYDGHDGSVPATRAAYQQHMVRMFKLSSFSQADAQTAGATTFRIEMALAALHQDQLTRRDPTSIYNKIDRIGLEKIASDFPWATYLQALGIANVTDISVNSPAYFTSWVKLLKSETPAALRAYLWWTVISESADVLSRAFVDENFAMAKLLSGAKQLPPRWRRCVHRVDNDLGELLAQPWVAANFPATSKTAALELSKAVLAAMSRRINTLEWMDDSTRVAAQQKLASMALLVGFPDVWRTYPFEVSRSTFANNVMAATRHEIVRNLNKIGKPVDRFDWQMTAPTVNAYYDPTLNEIALPGGQLQPPFFSASFHPAINFGDTGGGTIGHEMTHGFDDEGSQFDSNGNLRDWWSKATKEKFTVATTCVEAQYAQFDAVPGVKVNGKLTAGENIADIGGVKLAYQAYLTWRDAQPAGVVARTIGGMTDDQLYYLGYAQSWCSTTTAAELENMARTAPHAPAKWRVNGVVVNQPGFAAAFSCAPKTSMNPGTACAVW